MIRLTQEQIEYLENLYARKNEENNQMREMVSSTSKPIVCDSIHTGDSVDNITRTEQANLDLLISFIESTLGNYSVVEVIDDGKVHVGTTFTATINFDGEKTKTIKTLVEQRLPGDDYKKFISLESSVGRAILGKSVGETFTYSQKDLNGSVNNFTMTIDEIIKTKKHTR